ncbi:MAG: hypothetical protein LQ352_008405, partial [Teloschistes flavicans]
MNLLLVVVSLLSLAVASSIEGSIAPQAATKELLPRFDYEPGDMLNRTMCFCQAKGLNLKQLPAFPYGFYNWTEDSNFAYHFKFQYYNHRFDRYVTAKGSEICETFAGTSDTYFYNHCLHWENLHRHFCILVEFVSPVPVKQENWKFCYNHYGDWMEAAWVKDSFSFDGGLRDLPRNQDYIAPPDLVD